jgi:hypothetical protein
VLPFDGHPQQQDKNSQRRPSPCRYPALSSLHSRHLQRIPLQKRVEVIQFRRDTVQSVGNLSDLVISHDVLDTGRRSEVPAAEPALRCSVSFRRGGEPCGETEFGYTFVCAERLETSPTFGTWGALLSSVSMDDPCPFSRALPTRGKSKCSRGRELTNE